MTDQTPEPLTGEDLNDIVFRGEPLSDRTIGALVAAVEDARSWARHGYEIGQRSCTWSDYGVAPAWLTEGYAPESLEPGEDQRRLFGLDEENTKLRARIAELSDGQGDLIRKLSKASARIAELEAELAKANSAAGNLLGAAVSFAREADQTPTEPIGYAVAVNVDGGRIVQASALLPKSVALARAENYRTEFGMTTSVVELREVSGE